MSEGTRERQQTLTRGARVPQSQREPEKNCSVGGKELALAPPVSRWRLPLALEPSLPMVPTDGASRPPLAPPVGASHPPMAPLDGTY
ncbi:hypothetical protein EYF80_005378 [Liparis tanakae]|uniref:Uncharacterized protein n=1 Tax=Liparis tanakae TaxID=230148 RepID=A0A4Z2J210_9TELE|nr:hypothetical protein EYF80_005378 [Liparis tanakae]